MYRSAEQWNCLFLSSYILANPIVTLIVYHILVDWQSSPLFVSCRSMLYNGSEVIRDLEWVIFDEVHYINDAEVRAN